jgi:hypothetical protein
MGYGLRGCGMRPTRHAWWLCGFVGSPQLRLAYTRRSACVVWVGGPHEVHSGKRHDTHAACQTRRNTRVAAEAREGQAARLGGRSDRPASPHVTPSVAAKLQSTPS